MKIKQLLTILTFTTLSLNHIYSDTITMDDFIKKSLQNSRFEEYLLDEISEIYKKELEVPPGDFILSITPKYKLTYKSEPSHDLGFEGDISKLFTTTATSISGGYKLETKNSDKSFPTSSFNIGLEQQIIKNAFGRMSRVKKNIAANAKDIAEYQIIEAYEDYLASLITLFIDWYASYENMKFSEKSLSDSKKLLEITQKKQSYNIALPVDILKTELQVKKKRETLINKEYNYKKQLLKIKNIMSMDDSTQDISPSFTFDKNIKVNITEDFKEFNTKSRSASILRLTQNNENLDLKVKFDDLLPSANLYGNYTVSGNGYATNLAQKNVLELGVKFKLDIPQIGSFADYNLQENKIKKEILTGKTKLQDWWIDFKTLNYDIEFEKSLITIAEESIVLSEKILEAEKKEYNQGNSSLDNLLNLYDSLDNNRLSKITHFTQYANHYVEWLRLSDKLISNQKDLTIENF